MVSASVRPFASMDSAMTGQTGGIRELLSATRLHAGVRLLAGVSPDVNVECAALNEGLPAAFLVALEWPSFCVNTVVSLQVRLPVESFVAVGPVTRPRARRRFRVHDF